MAEPEDLFITLWKSWKWQPRFALKTVRVLPTAGRERKKRTKVFSKFLGVFLFLAYSLDER